MVEIFFSFSTFSEYDFIYTSKLHLIDKSNRYPF